MKILDLQTGSIHEYGDNGHDSLYVSPDGKHLTYYNLQNGDGSGVGDYRFICDDNKVPQESRTADAIHAEVYFNIGGWHKPTGHWIAQGKEYVECDNCNTWFKKRYLPYSNYCCKCGAKMIEEAKDETIASNSRT
mgnify:CR=1 FL=1